MTTQDQTIASTRVFMTSLIDYAGLFPPANCSMADAALNYARYLADQDAWMLSRFICSASRLEELSKNAASLMPGTFATSGYREMANIADPWLISVVIDGPLDRCLDQIHDFNTRHSNEDQGLALVDALEMRAATPSSIDEAMEIIPEDIMPFFEIPIDNDCRGFVAAVAGYLDQGTIAAKVRCGGITPNAIPPASQIAAFITACAAARVPFKATAGLHHPIRAEYRLTYEDSPPKAIMFGFVNVFFAAAAARFAKASPQTIEQILNETNPSAFKFTDQTVSWNNDISVDTTTMARSRETFALAYGSCSFTEPTTEMRTLNLM